MASKAGLELTCLKGSKAAQGTTCPVQIYPAQELEQTMLYKAAKVPLPRQRNQLNVLSNSSHEHAKGVVDYEKSEFAGIFAGYGKGQILMDFALLYIFLSGQDLRL
jgi:hypothetical protein